MDSATRLSGMEGIYRDFRTKANRVDIQMILLSSKQQYLETSYSLYVWMHLNLFEVNVSF
jgi:hypothetical protein